MTAIAGSELMGAASRTSGRGALHYAATLLVAATWISGAIFGAYILTFFGGTALAGATARWNESLPALHDAAVPLATAAIGLHFAAGGVLLLFGPVQLLGVIRRVAPGLHRWLGRAYVIAAGLAGVGGLVFIAAKGTIGGPVMDAGFGLYGALMVVTAAQAYRFARTRRYGAHRAWAIRLFALTVGSWLYRMEYALWFLTAGRAGHAADFSGWFDAAMVFFFYLPNLAVAELFIRAGSRPTGLALRSTATGVLLAASAFVVVATWSFTADYWGPGMIAGLTASAQ